MKLISFLGRVPKNEQGYRKTAYTFDDGTQTEPVSFIGWPLIERLKPESVVILGTSGIMWDHLLSSIALEIDAELHLDLLTQVEGKCVEQAMLDRLEPAFSEFHHIDCKFAIIPYGRDMDEQIHIMEVIADLVPKDSVVALDVTHGFRHLPMLGLVSAQYLQRLKHAEIQGIYYGMYDPDLCIGEVYDLKGMLQLNAWTFALSQFDKDGDYSVFSESLRRDGFSEYGVTALERAAYFERTFNVANARQQLTTFKQELGNALPGAGHLFTTALKDRVAWANSNNLYAHQRKLARFYLKNNDYVRAAVFGVEAFISSLMREDEREYQHEDREKAEQEFRDRDRGDARYSEPFKNLKKIRNSLAHGSQAKNAKERLILGDESKLEQYLRQLFNALGL